MSRPVVSVHPDLPAHAALVLLLEHRFAALPVVVDHRVVGVVGEADLLRSGMDSSTAGSGAGSKAGTVVADVMTVPAITMPTDATVAELTRAMLDGGPHSVPIVDADGVLVGMVGRVDLLRTLVHDDDVVVDRVNRVLHAYAGTRTRWEVELADGVLRVAGVFADEAERRLVVALARTVVGVEQVELRTTAGANRPS